MSNESEWSGPQPAIPDDEPSGGLMPERGSMLDMLSDDVSCENCQHFDVCAIFKGVAPMMADWPQHSDEDDAPVDPTNLAVICRRFDPDESVDDVT